jgi:hypothetical protein
MPFSNLYSIEDAEKIHPKSIINFLSDTVELSESLTLKSLFDIVSLNIGAFNEIFYTSLGGYPIEPYLQEIENNKTETIESDFLEFYWMCDKYDNELNISPSIHGISINKKETYALDFVSLNNIKNHIVKLNKNVTIMEYRLNDDYNVVNKPFGDLNFTLFDLYNALFTEISFHGGPNDKKERFDDLQESIIDSENEIDDSNNYTTLSDMIDRLESSDKYLVKYKKLRDRVDINRISDDKNLEKIKSALSEKLRMFDEISKSKKDVHKYYKKITDIEYTLQLLYDEDEDISYHRFWETPKCTCPKIDNVEKYPSDKPIFDYNCPIHGTKKSKNKKTS